MARKLRVTANEELKLEKWVLDGLAPAIKHSGTERIHVNSVQHSLPKVAIGPLTIQIYIYTYIHMARIKVLSCALKTKNPKELGSRINDGHNNYVLNDR